MSSVHVARQGFITKSALPSVSRARGSTTVADNKTVLLLNGNGTNGAQNNTFVTDNFGTASGKGNYSVFFDGTGDYLSSPNVAALRLGAGDFTVEAWIYPNSVTNTFASPICGTYGYVNSQDRGWGFSLTSTGKLNLFTGGSSGAGVSVTSTDTIVANTWTHVAAVRSGTTVTLYINGVANGTVTNTKDEDYSVVDFNIGTSRADQLSPATGNAAQSFRGYISNLRVVKGTAVYTSAFTPPTSELTAISGTSLLTCQGTVIRDASTNNFAITRNGDVKVATNTSSAPIAITRNGNATQGSFSPFTLPDGQWSNFFDGTGDSLTAADNATFDVGANNWTIECWANFSNVSGEKGLISHFAGTNNGYVLRLSTGNSPSGLRLVCSTTGTDIVLQAAWTPIVGTWYHIAAVRDSSTLRLYVDGVQIGSTSIAITIGNPATPFAVGTAQTVASSDMNGYISNVRLVNGTCLYTGGTTFTPPTTPLTAITNTSLLTCQSNRFRDNSSNNFAITRNGDVRVTPWSPFAPTSAYDPATNGGSGYFDGTGDYVSTPSNSAFDIKSGNFTIEFWLHPLLIKTTYLIRRQSMTTYNGYTVFLQNTGAIRLDLGSPGGLTSTSTVRVNEWSHIAIVNSSGTTTIYINGVSSGSFTLPSGSEDTGSFFVGGTDHNSAECLNGYMTNLRVVKGTAVYTSAFTPPTAPVTNITNTSLLLNFTNAGIFDTAGDNVIETVGNAQIDTAVKKYGTGSLEFDGSGDRLLCYAPRMLPQGREAYTIEAWVYLTSSTSTTQEIVSWGTKTTNNFAGLWVTSGGITFYNWSNDLATGNISLVTNTWYHIAAQYDGTTRRIFVNGVQRATDTTTSVNIAATDRVTVGAQDGGSFEIAGYIDDLRITKGQARYTSAGFTPPTAELITYGTSENIVNNSTYGVYQLA